MNNHKYDIAISLCKEDVDYAEALIKELNPKLNIFFYADRQEELIGELGPEKFGKVFKEEARVVVILYRETWSESYYTELERGAILDRTAKPDQGQSFIIVIGMEPGKVPSWYPSSRIYANPMNFSTAQMASFMEFKVNERGGDVSPVTFEEQAEILNKKIEYRKNLIRFLESPESVNPALEELDRIVKGVNEKIEFIKGLEVDFKKGWLPFNSNPAQTMQPISAYIDLDRFRIVFDISFFNIVNRKCSQNITLCVSYLEDQHHISSSTIGLEKFIESFKFEYKFNADKGKSGWSAVEYITDEEANRNGQLYFGLMKKYDLGRIYTTQELVNHHLKELVSKVETIFKGIL